MKYKLKELQFDNLKHNSCKTTLGKVINLEETYEFQTPTVKIVGIDPDYITLSLLPSEACKIFYDKIHDFEKKVKQVFKNDIIPLFENETFRVKIKNDTFKIYYQSSLFNRYQLQPGMDLILLVSINKLWENLYNVINYNLKVNEIVIKNNNLT